MLDALGMAEATPGPLVMVVQFVGFMGAYRHAGGMPPMLARIIGSIVTVWVTFVPYFLWTFFGGPYIEKLRRSQNISASLCAISAAVVGVILNLSTWFALPTIFGTVHERDLGPARLFVPDWNTVSAPALVLTMLAMIAVFRLRAGMAKTLAASALLGVFWKNLLA